MLSFVGATGSTTISFILPGLFYFSLFRKSPDAPKLLKYGSALLAIYGVCVMCFCLTSVPPSSLYFTLCLLDDQADRLSHSTPGAPQLQHHQDLLLWL